MAAAGTSLCEDQFLCSICLDVFTHPVSTPCGHNFCKKCITEHWDNCGFFDCPNCNKNFYTRPELQVNTFVSEMVAHFRESTQQKVISLRKQAPEPGDVLCDFCMGTKLKALKSCLVCLVSYCETHLEPHLTVSRLKRHKLINPLENLEGRICTEHDKLLELFCKTDQTCVCSLCIVSQHKSHDVVPLKEEYERKLADLCETEADIQQLISKKQLKIQEFKHSVNVSKKAADREIAESIQVFTELREAPERNQAEVIETVEEKHRRTEKQAEGFIKELEEEIFELKKRSAELKQLSHSEDHLNFLQSFKSVNAVQPTRDWKDVKVCPPLYEGTVRTAVSKMVKMLKNETKRPLTEIDLKTVQQYAVDVTLDPDTANQSHEVVPLEYERKKAKLQKTKVKINYVIKGRQEKIQEFKHSINTSKESMDRELADISRVFTKIKKALERKEAKVIKKTEEKHRMTEKQAEGFIAELEQETSELKKRSAELKRLLDSKDHVYFLQNFPSTKSRFKKWTDVKVCPPLYKGDVQTAVAKMLKKETKRFLKETKLKTVQQYAVDVALDPDTANTQLILSEDGKQVHHSPLWNNLPDNPKRFHTGLCVLGRQFVSSGRFYFEVLVKGKPNWGLGVASESVDRKGRPTFSPKGGYWTICLRRQNVYSVFTETLVDLSLKSKPEKVGVFVDYEEGLVSFYDVDAAALIFTYTGCSFMEKLFPVFLPGANQGGKNAAPLIICPVNPT